MRFKFVTKFCNVLRHFPSNCNFIIIICMHMCVSIASVCKLLRTVLPTCCKNVCGQVQTTNCSTHTHTLTDTQRFNQLCTTGGALAACKHTHIYNCYVCMCTRQRKKTKHKRKTNNNNSMRKNQLTSSSLLLLCC